VGRRKGTCGDDLACDYGERDAERLVAEGARVLGISAEPGDLALMKKGDERKALLAALLRQKTGVATAWIARRLAMGHPGSVSRLIGSVRKDPVLANRCRKLGTMSFGGP
jgi:hypothetical protein